MEGTPGPVPRPPPPPPGLGVARRRAARALRLEPIWTGVRRWKGGEERENFAGGRGARALRRAPTRPPLGHPAATQPPRRRVAARQRAPPRRSRLPRPRTPSTPSRVELGFGVPLPARGTHVPSSPPREGCDKGHVTRRVTMAGGCEGRCCSAINGLICQPRSRKPGQVPPQARACRRARARSWRTGEYGYAVGSRVAVLCSRLPVAGCHGGRRCSRTVSVSARARYRYTLLAHGNGIGVRRSTDIHVGAVSDGGGGGGGSGGGGVRRGQWRGWVGPAGR